MSSRDKRIVEMRFDNAAFEKGAAQSMNTLDKLKQSLNFDKVTNGMADSFGVMKNEFASLSETFTSTATTFKSVFLGTLAGQTAYKGVVAGFNFIKKGYDATIGQIISGGKARAQNIEQAKFQLGGLGVDWDAIYEDLDYAVAGTAYGLDAAAKVGSQFVASGVQLGDDMKAALRGISGVAAMTNSSYEEIGNIFTTVAGQGKLMTIQLNQLASRGLNVAGTLAEAFGTTEGEIREMVSKGKIDFATFATAMNEAFGEHATKANDTFSGSLSNMKAALSRIGALFATPAYDNLRIVINAVTPVINAFKKAVTPVADEVARLMEVGANLAKTLLENFDTSVFTKIATPLTAFISMITNSISTLSETITGNPLSKAADAIKKFTDAEKQAARDIWVWGTYGDGEVRKKKLKEAGLEYANVQEYLEKYVMTCDEAAYEEAIAADNAEELAKKSTAAGKIMRNAKWYSVFRGLGFKEDTTKSIVNFIETVRNLGVVVKNVATSIANVVTAAITGILHYSGYEDLTINIEDISLKLAALSEKFVLTVTKVKPVTSVFKFLTGVLVGVATIIAKVLNGVGLAAKDFKNFVEFGDMADIKSSGFMSKVIVSVGNVVREFKLANGSIKNFIDIVSKLTGVNKLIESIKNTYAEVKKVFKKDEDTSIESYGDDVSWLADFIDTITPGMAAAIDGITDKLSVFISKIPGWASDMAYFVKTLYGDAGYDVENKSIFGIIKDVLDDISILITGYKTPANVRVSFSEIASSMVNGLIDGVKNAISSFNWQEFQKFSIFTGIIAILFQFNKAINGVNDTITNVRSLPQNINKCATSISTFFSTMNKSLKQLTAVGAISVVALSIAALVMSITYLADMPVEALARAVVYVVLIMEALKSIIKAADNLGNATANINISNVSGSVNLIGPLMGLGIMLFGLASAIAVIYFAIQGFNKMNQEDLATNIARVVIVILLILSSMALLVAIIKGFNVTRIPASFIVTIGLVAASIAGVMLAMTGAGVILGTIDAGKVDTIMMTLTNFMAALIAMLLSISLIGMSGIKQNEILAISSTLGSFGFAIAIMCAGIAAIILASKESNLSEDALKSVIKWLEIMALTVIGALLAGGIMLQVSNNVSGSDMHAVAKAILIASASFAIIAVSMAMIMKNIGNGADFAGVAIGVSLLMAAITAMLLFTTWITKKNGFNANEMIKIGAAIAIVAGTFVLMAAALALIGKIDTDLLRVVGVVSIATLAIIALAVVGTRYGDGINKIAMAMVLFAGSGLIFAASVWLLAKAIDALSAALPAFAIGLATFFDSLKENKTAIAAMIVVLVVVIAAMAAAVYAVVRFGPQLEAATDTILRIVQNLLNYWNSLPVNMQRKITAAVGAIAIGLAAATPDVIEAIGDVFIQIMQYLGVLAGPLVNGLLILVINIINALADAIRGNSGPIMAAVINLLTAAMELLIKVTEIVVAPILDLWELIYTDTLLSLETGIHATFGTVLKNMGNFIGTAIDGVRWLHHQLMNVIGKDPLLKLVFGIDDLEVKQAEIDAKYDEMIRNKTKGLFDAATDEFKLMSTQTNMLLDDFYNIGDVIMGKRPGEWREAFEAGLPDYSGWFANYAKSVTDTYNTAESMNAAMDSLHEAIQKQKNVVQEAADPKQRAAAQHAADAMAATQKTLATSPTTLLSASGAGSTIASALMGGFSNFIASDDNKNSLISGMNGLLGDAGANVNYDSFLSEIQNGSIDMSDPEAIANYFPGMDANLGEQMSNLLQNSAAQGMDGYTLGFELGTPEAVDAADAVADDTVDAFKDKQDDAEEAGKFFTGGLARGIWDKRNVVMEKVQMVADYAVAQLRRSLDEHSPSRVTEELGKFFTLGFANGVEGYSDVAVEKTATMAERTTEAFRSSLQTISDAISSDVEANPTIRPVMDLSNVRDSVTSINSMFSSQSARYAAINNRLSNETAAYRFELDQSSRYDNSDVVSAISGMQDEMTGLKDAMMDTQIVMDSGVLVGQLAPGMDRTLGRMSTRKSRRN